MGISHEWAASLGGCEHQALWLAGDSRAAVLVHGFPGTPAEMRSMAELLHRRRWTVRAPLLPGFGQELCTLEKRTREDWVAAVAAEWRWLSESHAPALLVGYSMGAAIALEVAVRERVPALALIAPMHRLEGPWFTWLWPLVRLMPTVKPFRHLPVDLEDPGVRAAVAHYAPGLDLDDPSLRRRVADFTLPMRVIEQMVCAGREAYAHAPAYRGRTLLVQARQDTVIDRAGTLALAARLGGPVTYTEVEGGHDMILPDRAGWEGLERVLQRFSEDVAPLSPASPARL